MVSQPLVRMRSVTALPTTTITHWARKGREDSKPFWTHNDSKRTHLPYIVMQVTPRK